MAKDSNPALTRSYLKGKAVAERQFGNPERALRDGYQYENSEKNHHKRGIPVRTDKRVVDQLDKETRQHKHYPSANKG